MKSKKDKKIELFLVVLILLVATFFRLYRIYDYATFLGDEGRDALVVKRMIVDHKFTLLGPMTSVGNMYLGPIYYYLMMIPLWLSKLNPIGPAVMVALFGIATVFLIYLLGKDFFSREVGLIAASFYAISQAIIVHTRFSWNPNPVPFFSTVAIYSFLKILKEKKGWWFIPLGLSLGICFQLHYITLILIFSFLVMFLIFKPQVEKKWWFLGVGAFLLIFLPIFIFELRHHFVISQGLVRFFRQEKKVGFSPLIFLKKGVFIYQRLFYRFVGTEKKILALALSLFGLIPFLNKKDITIKVLAIWLVIGMMGVSFYTGDIHDHYLGFLFPVPFLLTALFIFRISKTKLSFLAWAFFSYLLLINFLNLDLFAKRGPNYQIERAMRVGKSIAENANGSKFNIALISPTLDFRALNYRYFTEIYGARPQGYENYHDIENLYVIVEGKVFDLENTPSWEVASFGPAEIAQHWDFDFGFQVFKLRKKG